MHASSKAKAIKGIKNSSNLFGNSTALNDVTVNAGSKLSIESDMRSDSSFLGVFRDGEEGGGTVEISLAEAGNHFRFAAAQTGEHFSGDFVLTSPIRFSTRLTWVSTGKPGRPKALPKMTLALLRPIPGSFSNSAMVRGTVPPNLSMIICAAARKLRLFVSNNPQA